jgi:uncharacterized protein (TIGR02246 family)
MALTSPLVLSLLWALTTSPPVPAPTASPSQDATSQARADVEALVRTQVDAWNRGDLEAFCAVYAEDVLFISPGGVTRGRAQVLERYKKKYPDAKARGVLTIDVVESRAVPTNDAVNTVSVVGKWKVARQGQKSLSGHTLIVFQRQPEGWKLVQDASM